MENDYVAELRWTVRIKAKDLLGASREAEARLAKYLASGDPREDLMVSEKLD